MVGLCALCVLCVTILLPQRVQEYNKNMLSTEGKTSPEKSDWNGRLLLDSDENKVSCSWTVGSGWLEQTAEWDGDKEREHQKWKSRSKKAGQDVCAQCQATEPALMFVSVSCYLDWAYQDAALSLPAPSSTPSVLFQAKWLFGTRAAGACEPRLRAVAGETDGPK